MIFNVPHIAMIQNGLFYERNRIRYPDMIVKTQTRRLNRGIYQVGKDYAVQRKRGVKAESDIRIVMDRIWKEDCLADDELGHGGFFIPKIISEEDARAEGWYAPEEFEEIFRKINPNWNGIIRYGFEFHAIEVRRNVPSITSHAREEKLERSLKHLHQEIIEHIHPYVTTKIEKVRK